MRRIRLPRGLKLTEVFLAAGLGIICGLYSWTPLIKEYKLHEAKVLEERKKIQEEKTDIKIEEKKIEESSK